MGGSSVGETVGSIVGSVAGGAAKAYKSHPPIYSMECC